MFTFIVRRQAKISNLYTSDVPYARRAQDIDLTYMGGTGSCEPIKRIYNANQRIANTSICAMFERNRNYHGLKEGQTDIAQQS